MNPQIDPIAAFQNDISQFEHAISCYIGSDPLDLWFKFICWLESNVISTPALEAKFRKAVEQCLSTYDKFENYKQDIRMVKLWIKYIDFQPNPLNLYKILYQQGIGTTCSAFYIGWAHYYNSANLFKQAESIFNLGIQLKAQPIAELENAQKNFRFSVAQRMLYNDESSKKRTISSLAEQRQQITSLSPHQSHQQPSKRIKLDGDQNEQQQSHQYQQQDDYQYASTSSDPGYVISSSLNYVYDDSNVYQQAEVVQEEVAQVIYSFEDGFKAPAKFASYTRNSQEPWNALLFLEEPFDPNQRCFYPKHLVYPGNGQEYSLEELKSQKWRAKVEEKRKLEQLRIQQEAEALRLRQEQERLRQEQEAKRLIEEQERIRKEQEAHLARVEQEKLLQMSYQQPPNPSWNQSPYYYQHSYENSPQYSYSHDHMYQYQQNMYQQSPQSYQNSPNYMQQQSVIVNRGQYEIPPPAGDPFYSSPNHQYAGTSYQGYHQVPSHQQPPAAQPARPPVAAGARDEADYQDVEYLIDHQGEIDPKILQQPIVESFEDEEEESSYDESDEEEEAYTGPPPVVNSYMLDDLEEQIEASTISFSSNGKSRDKKITIKFRKEKTTTTIINSESNSESSQPVPVKNFAVVPKSSLEPSSTSSSSSGKKKSRKQKFQSEILNTFDGDNTQFMPSATNSCSSTANGEFNNTFSSITFNGCVTPVRKQVSKTSTPVSSYKFLKKPESVLSNQNEDSICSYNGDQNSFFQAENDEEFKGRRLERAVATIDEHLKKRDIDPFNSELCRAFLIKLNFPTRENTTDYKITSVNLPKLSKNQMVPLGGYSYQIEKEVGRGSYGAVYRGINTSDGSVVALKYQKPPNSWELYICTEVKKRLKNATNILPGFMSISAAVIAPNASVLISEFSQYGSLLDINNRIRQATTKVMHESLVMHFTSQILNIVSHLHSCNIIHADIKPDNFLLMTLPSAETYVPSLRLIDFGCAIDMNLFKEGTEFRKIIQTDGFTCTEMQEGRPWSYQTDLFCVAGTIHVMLFGEYMQVNKKFGVWEIKQKFPRYLNKTVWSEVFSKLLNIKDKNHLPDLRQMRSLINSEINDNELVKHIRTCSNLIRKR